MRGIFLVATSWYTIVTVVLTSLFVYKRWKLRIQALDYLIGMFGLLAMGGIIDLIAVWFFDSHIFGLVADVNHPVGYNLGRNFTLLAMIVLFIFSQNLLYERLQLVETMMIFMFSLFYIIELLYFKTANNLIYLDEIAPLFQHVRLGDLSFDLITLISLLSVIYAYYRQYQVTEIEHYRHNQLAMLSGLVVFLLVFSFRISRLLINMPQIEVVYAAIPMFIIMAYLYLSDPYYVYYSTADISFLQITTTTGHLLYAVELQEIIKPRDYLISISLSSFYSVLQEIIDPDEIYQLKIKSIRFNKGVLLFEQVGDILVIVHADRMNRILKRSIAHFIKEFDRKYGKIIQPVPGGVVFDPFDKPDELLKQCIPMLQSKQMITEPSKRPRMVKV